MNQRYLVAKYAPDIMRMEPRNIGIILWADGRLASRFLASDEAEFVDEKPVYERWVAYWNRLLVERQVVNGQTVSADVPEFLEGLLHTQEGNFLLLDGGRVHDPIEANELQDAADFLFGELVAPVRDHSTEKEVNALQFRCDQLFQAAGLVDRSDWRGAKEVVRDVKGVPRPFTFHYVFGSEDEPTALFQRVALVRPQAVNSTSFMMEYAKPIPKKHRAVLYDATNANEAATDAVAVLAKFATVIDVSSRKAEQLIERVAG